MPRAVPESWLVGALLILFGVAITAALPPISAAVRGAMTDAAAKDAQGIERAERKASLRLRLVAVRLVEPAAPQGAHAVPVAPDNAVAILRNHAIFARPIDLAAQVRLRGFSARAPPA
jgi:type II secretory pathway pseudopilin PulG